MSDEQIIKNADSIFNYIDTNTRYSSVNYYAKYSDSEIITSSLFTDKNCIKKLTFHFVDINLSDTSYINNNNIITNYYFNDIGDLIGRKKILNCGDRGYQAELYIKKNTLFFRKDIDQSFKIEEYTDDTSFFYKANIESYLYTFLFNKKYRVKRINPFNGPVLITTSKVQLLQSPNNTSSNLTFLNVDTKLFLLDVSENLDTIDQRVWRLYKVKTEDNEIGWVFGYPKFVTTYYPHDCPD